MTSHFRHRLACENDFDALLDLQRRATLGLSGDHYCLESMRLALSEVPILTPDLVTDGHYHVLTDSNGSIRAGGGWSRRTPGYADASGERLKILPSGHALVRAVNVDPAFARRGLGRRIMQLIEEDAVSHGIHHLSMTATMPGLPLYFGLGYRCLEPVEGKLSNGYTVRLQAMEKELCRRPGAVSSDLCAETKVNTTQFPKEDRISSGW
ncbi:GNAT family N-acetyltransferase [Rhodobacterales bacterium HKCCE3408]|nr:GNAT family N-acetyltransferase [Rhodobacterales bacterium HKCCE3408]